MDGQSETRILRQRTLTQARRIAEYGLHSYLTFLTPGLHTCGIGGSGIVSPRTAAFWGQAVRARLAVEVGGPMREA